MCQRKGSDVLEEVLVLPVDRAQLLAVLPEGGDLLLLLLLAQLLLPLELRLLSSKLLEARLVVLDPLLLQEKLDDSLWHIVLRVIRIVVVRHLAMLGEALVDVETKVQGAVSAPWPAPEVLEPINVLDLGEEGVRRWFLMIVLSVAVHFV